MWFVSPNPYPPIVIYLVDSAIQRLNNRGQINLYPMDSAIALPNTYPLDIDLSYV